MCYKTAAAILWTWNPQALQVVLSASNILVSMIIKSQIIQVNSENSTPSPCYSSKLACIAWTFVAACAKETLDQNKLVLAKPLKWCGLALGTLIKKLSPSLSLVVAKQLNDGTTSQ